MVSLASHCIQGSGALSGPAALRDFLTSDAREYVMRTWTTCCTTYWRNIRQETQREQGGTGDYEKYKGSKDINRGFKAKLISICVMLIVIVSEVVRLL